MNSADEQVAERLGRSESRATYDKFGFIFIVCATGKTAAEMLGLLESRLPHTTRTMNFALPQPNKTRLRILRLRKLLS